MRCGLVQLCLQDMMTSDMSEGTNATYLACHIARVQSLGKGHGPLAIGSCQTLWIDFCPATRYLVSQLCNSKVGQYLNNTHMHWAVQRTVCELAGSHRYRMDPRGALQWIVSTFFSWRESKQTPSRHGQQWEVLPNTLVKEIGTDQHQRGPRNPRASYAH